MEGNGHEKALAVKRLLAKESNTADGLVVLEALTSADPGNQHMLILQARYAAQLERRRYFRKTVHFPGTYSRAAGGCHAGRGTMDVLDLSRTGVKLRVGKHENLKVGDRLTVEFQLDDRRRSRISRESVVRRIDGMHLGAEFTPSDPADPNHKAIGFYLFAA